MLEDSDLRVLLDEDEEVAYGFDELDELTYAYAVSIHRAQGSEYPCVVIPVTTSAWLMLQRNLLYTAVTWAKRMVVLVGSRRAGQGSSDPGRPGLAIRVSRMRGSVAWLACTAWNGVAKNA